MNGFWGFAGAEALAVILILALTGACLACARGFVRGRRQPGAEKHGA